ncbi:Equilibrative nucleotide transporter 8 [Vitis vinifera]|uniref:Equilibrative nucleotide transporter 8 n=1 Tax=Vitis vinifera TaxID=29760 RepID=A0A438D9U1_VITVI|nr:Equilibrative nucleotide transporter 8 [Vitis vinifera]
MELMVLSFSSDNLWFGRWIDRRKLDRSSRELPGRGSSLHLENHNKGVPSSDPKRSPDERTLLFYHQHLYCVRMHYLLQHLGQVASHSKLPAKENHGQKNPSLQLLGCTRDSCDLRCNSVNLPRYLAENVESKLLQDWYPILLITTYNVSDLLGKSMAAIYVLRSIGKVTWGCIARLLFYPLFAACLHGPKWLRIPDEEAETAGFVMALFLAIGLATGSVIGWFWII